MDIVMKIRQSRQRIQTLRFLLRNISQSRSKTVTDMVKVLRACLICLGRCPGTAFRRSDPWKKKYTGADRRERFMTPTLSAEPGDLSLVLPKRILDGIIEMIYALDKIAPGTANDDTLLYGVEVKFYNMEVQLDEHLCYKKNLQNYMSFCLFPFFLMYKT